MPVTFQTTETSSLKSNYQNQPNQPLFILDGFETTAETVMDMDMNRIESITILKDASAKALYGSKAANGVIVIETKRLAGNEQRITYNGSLSFEMPDLTSYDLCNALEKLEAERLDGVYRNANLDTQIELNQLYNTRKQMALQGLDTYWLSSLLGNISCIIVLSSRITNCYICPIYSKMYNITFHFLYTCNPRNKPSLPLVALHFQPFLHKEQVLSSCMPSGIHS